MLVLQTYLSGYQTILKTHKTLKKEKHYYISYSKVFNLETFS